MSKRAFVSGVAGQDGAYLCKLLLDKGYQVFGGFRRNASDDFSRLQELGIEDQLELVQFELLEHSNIVRALERIKPDEIYNLAAQSFVVTSFEQPLFTSDANGLGVLRMLESIRSLDPKMRFYQASTSEMYGKAVEPLQSETTRFHPRSPYAVAKAFAFYSTVNYREAYGLHASNGILFNHESPLRGREFVTRKITTTIAAIQLGLKPVLELGNMAATRDWGFAGDYVDAMWRMLQQPAADDYVVATGESHSVEEFVTLAARYAEIPLAWRGEGAGREAVDTRSNKVIVRVNKEFYRPSDVESLRGDSSKARRALGWQPKVTFDELVRMMVEADLRRLRPRK
jgi:GDPmannose 4,6-dehydratase